ncbi:MAG: hypothetical protein RL557_411 [archaeon]|jgi:hypothetical protein
MTEGLTARVTDLREGNSVDGKLIVTRRTGFIAAVEESGTESVECHTYSFDLGRENVELHKVESHRVTPPDHNYYFYKSELKNREVLSGGNN